MRIVLLSLLVPLAACGSPDDGADMPVDADVPVVTDGDTLMAEAAPEETEEPTGPDEAALAEDEAAAPPTGPNEAELEADAEAMAAADAVLLADVLPGSWQIPVGPAESVTFAASETRGSGDVTFYLNDRPAGVGTWSVEGETLIISTTGPESGTYTVVEKGEDDLAFTGGPGGAGGVASLMLSRFAE